MKRPDIKFKLKYKFLAIAIGIILLTGLSMIIITKTVVTQKLVIEIQEKGIFMARHLSVMSANLVLTEQFVNLQILLNEYKQEDTDMEYAFIQDLQGHVLAHTFKSGFPIELKEINMPGAGQGHRIQSFVSDGMKIYDIAAPIMKGEAGSAHVGVSESFIRESAADVVRLIIKIIVGVLILGSGGALFFTAEITKPLSGLVDVATAVGSGNFDIKADVRSKDEIGRLGAAFNKMVRDLKETTVSRDRLTVEVAERRRAQEEVTEKKLELEKKNKEIDKNRSKLHVALTEVSALIEGVIQAKDHNVKFSNPNIKKCYEIKDCKKEDCPCYGKEAMRCWQIAGTYCGGKVQGFFAQKFGNCSNCDVYKEATSDPIYQIGEHFNNMMNILKSKNKELEEAYEELQTTSVKLAEINGELGQFTYIASHDLQEPLRMVTSYLQLLERRCKGRLGADADDFIGYAVDGATRMRTLITDLLTYSRVGTRGKEFQPVDCEDMIKQVLVNLQIAVEESDAVVTHGPLPTVMADDTQLSQLLQNLIGNAIKFNDNGSTRVHISAEEKGDEWTFSVKDNGIGIAPEYVDRIFGVFQRLHKKEEYPGTGIGLAVCRKIVERHGGKIWVESEPDKGSTFYFTISKTGGAQS